MRGSVDMNFLFTLGEVQRLMRAYADRQAARYGITRAQWAVLAKVERTEGLKQSELAEQMEMQPITLTRLIDKLCDNGWIERRGDETDRRVNRLYLRKAARPLLGKLAGLRSELTATALEGINPADAHRLLAQLEPDQGKRSQRDPESGRRTSQKGAALWLIPCSNFRPNRRAIRSPAPRPKLAAEPRRRLMAGMRRYRRFLLLVVLPLVALMAGVTFYLNGGRYVTTDDAYVGAQKVLITPDISGKIEKVVVKEGQQVSDRRRAVRDRSGAVPPRGGAGQGQARRRPRSPMTIWSPTSRSTARCSELVAAGHRAEAARRRAQVVAGEEQCRLAARPRQCVHRAGHRQRPAPVAAAEDRDRQGATARQSRTAARANSRPMPRPRRRSTRPSAISTTP